MVLTGYNMRDKVWSRQNIIVDVGFTAALFAKLALLDTINQEKYRNFLNKFALRYIELFYSYEDHAFSTSIDKNDRQQGGHFARGQAWALEGLIPAYRVCKDQHLRDVIQSTIDMLIKEQNKDGSWPYNLAHRLMGNDCKGVSVIAKSMTEWYKEEPNERMKCCAVKAYKWCVAHTSAEGEAKGGIFSFCTEGAIVQDLYSTCAFAYSSAYAIELVKMLKDE